MEDLLFSPNSAASLSRKMCNWNDSRTPPASFFLARGALKRRNDRLISRNQLSAQALVRDIFGPLQLAGIRAFPSDLFCFNVVFFHVHAGNCKQMVIALAGVSALSGFNLGNIKAGSTGKEYGVNAILELE